MGYGAKTDADYERSGRDAKVWEMAAPHLLGGVGRLGGAVVTIQFPAVEIGRAHV